LNYAELWLTRDEATLPTDVSLALPLHSEQYDVLLHTINHYSPGDLLVDDLFTGMRCANPTDCSVRLHDVCLGRLTLTHSSVTFEGPFDRDHATG
tara:strand:- start:55 stop:339 length:285 start_codon:yes stop_codon:yes gene_type:complete